MTGAPSQETKTAARYGAKGHWVGLIEDPVPALKTTFSAGSVHIAMLPIDYSENILVLVEELRGHMSDIETT